MVGKTPSPNEHDIGLVNGSDLLSVVFAGVVECKSCNALCLVLGADLVTLNNAFHSLKYNFFSINNELDFSGYLISMIRTTVFSRKLFTESFTFHLK